MHTSFILSICRPLRGTNQRQDDGIVHKLLVYFFRCASCDIFLLLYNYHAWWIVRKCLSMTHVGST